MYVHILKVTELSANALVKICMRRANQQICLVLLYVR
jgi:hypothetical protein